MKLEKYIKEDVSDKELETFLKETKQFRDEMDGVRLWRAHDRKIVGLKKMKARKDRRPKDTPQEVHEWLDDWFKETFGWRARSQGVFASTTPNGIDIFGKNTSLIYPVNGYKYVWSDTIEDLTKWLEDYGYIENIGGNKWRVTDRFEDESVRKDLKKVLSREYHHRNLDRASWYGTEVMLYCPNGYYLIGDGDFFRNNYYEIEGIYK